MSESLSLEDKIAKVMAGISKSSAILKSPAPTPIKAMQAISPLPSATQPLTPLIQSTVDTFLRDLEDEFEEKDTITTKSVNTFFNAECLQPDNQLTAEESERIRHKLLAAAFSLYGANLDAMFQKLDTHKRGVINMMEFKGAIMELLPKANTEEVNSLMKALDKVKSFTFNKCMPYKFNCITFYLLG